MNVSSRLALSAALLVLPVAAAHAETKSTIVVMHRNIRNVQDEANWGRLANNLSSDGFRVVSVALSPSETAAEASSQLLKLLHEDNDRNVVLVGTASASEAVNLTAQAEPSAIRAAIYVSAADQVPAFGPRTVDVPASVASSLSVYQVKVTAGKHLASRRENNATTYLIREQGNSTLGRIDDLQNVIETVSHMNKAQA